MNIKLNIGTLIFILIISLIIPNNVHAQREIGINIGAAVPVGDLGDASGTGISIGADYFYQVFDNYPNLRLGGRLAFNSFSENDYEQFGADVSSSAFSVEITPAMRYIFTKEEKRVGYFAQAALGLYVTRLDFNNFPIDDTHTESDFGINIGGGVTYRLLNTITVVAMPLYHFTDKSFISVNVGFIFGRREKVIIVE